MCNLFSWYRVSEHVVTDRLWLGNFIATLHNWLWLFGTHTQDLKIKKLTHAPNRGSTISDTQRRNILNQNGNEKGWL